jgi:HAD superfamily hydrolase (TIGR01509 family)
VRRQESEIILAQHIPDSAQLATFVARSDALYSAELDSNIPVKSGAVELLEKLASKGIPCAVATSSETRNAEHHLERAGLLGFFQSVTGGDQVVHAKPAPDIYQKAAQTLGTSAHDCAAFEDSDPGTRAAIASGARVVQVPDLVTPTDELRAMGHIIAPSLLAGAAKIGLI